MSPLCGCALPAVCLELVPESDDHIAPGDNVLVVGDVYDAGADPFGISCITATLSLRISPYQRKQITHGNETFYNTLSPYLQCYYQINSY